MPLWNKVSALAPPATGEVHVWRIPLDPPRAGASSLLPCLSDDERGRAAAFHFEADRDRYVVAHAALRTLLSRYLDRPALPDAFRLDLHGKPSLASDPMLRFNLAHSRDLALVALSTGPEIGIDLEAIDSRVEIGAVAQRFFSPVECRRLQALPVGLRLDAFFHVWSQKEAYLKGRGDGVGLGLDHFDVQADPGEPAALLADRRDPDAPRRWSLHTIDPGAGFRGALAVEGARPVLCRFGWE